MEDPKIAHKQIDGKHTSGAVTATNAVAIKKFSPLGKKAVAAVRATTQAFGFINWNKAASYSFRGLPLSLLEFENDPIIFQLKNNK